MIAGTPDTTRSKSPILSACCNRMPPMPARWLRRPSKRCRLRARVNAAHPCSTPSLPIRNWSPPPRFKNCNPLSANTSCNLRAAELLDRIRRGEKPSLEFVKQLGEDCPGEFVRGVIEPLADSFDAADAELYTEIMRPWVPAAPRTRPEIPARVETVY